MTPQKYYATADFSAFTGANLNALNDGWMTLNEVRAAEKLPPPPIEPPPPCDVYGIRSSRDARRFEKEFNRQLREMEPGRFVILPRGMEQIPLTVPRIPTRRYELAPKQCRGWLVATFFLLSAIAFWARH